MFILTLWASGSTPSWAEGKNFALIIANGAYGNGLSSLANPSQDAAVMAQALQHVGFSVTVVRDADLETMQKAVVDQAERLRAAGDGAVSFIHFSGHGSASLDRTEDYLIPVSAAISSELSLPTRAYRLTDLLKTIEDAKPAVSFISIDACRNVAFPRSVSRAVERGLAKIDGAQGTLIAFATAPDKTAEDGPGGQGSTFSRALAAEIAKGGESHSDVFKNVQIAVAEATGDRQVPWYTDGIVGRFVFKTNGSAPLAITGLASPPTGEAVAQIMPPESAAERRSRAIEARESLARMGLTADEAGFVRSVQSEDSLSTPLYIDAGVKLSPDEIGVLYPHLIKMDEEVTREMASAKSVKSFATGWDEAFCTSRFRGDLLSWDQLDNHLSVANPGVKGLFLSICDSVANRVKWREGIDAIKAQLSLLFDEQGAFSVKHCVAAYGMADIKTEERTWSLNKALLATVEMVPISPWGFAPNNYASFANFRYNEVAVAQSVRTAPLADECAKLRDRAEPALVMATRLERAIAALPRRPQ